MIVEICANSFESAYNAQLAGAQRIELCSELAVGGVTPSFGLMSQVKSSLSIPVFVLIRPRSGDFVYSSAEFEIMKKDVELCKELGCSGVVSGVLNTDNSIDIIRTQELVNLAKPLPFVFHRAFDLVPNPVKALNQLLQLGVIRILTSGHESSAIKGLKLLNELKELAKEAITILPGGGITVENAKQFQEAGFKEIHCSLTEFHPFNVQPKIHFNSPKHFIESGKFISDTSKIKEILQLLNEPK